MEKMKYDCGILQTTGCTHGLHTCAELV